MDKHKALTQLREDTSRVVLSANKGVAMVIMDKADYTNIALTLLDDTNTYRVLNKDPTTKIKKKLIQTLKDIKQVGGLSNQKYRKLCPTNAVPPSFMSFPKYTKLVLPSGPQCPVGVP